LAQAPVAIFLPATPCERLRLSVMKKHSRARAELGAGRCHSSMPPRSQVYDSKELSDVRFLRGNHYLSQFLGLRKSIREQLLRREARNDRHLSFLIKKADQKVQNLSRKNCRLSREHVKGDSRKTHRLGRGKETISCKGDWDAERLEYLAGYGEEYADYTDDEFDHIGFDDWGHGDVDALPAVYYDPGPPMPDMANWGDAVAIEGHRPKPVSASSDTLCPICFETNVDTVSYFKVANHSWENDDRCDAHGTCWSCLQRYVEIKIVEEGIWNIKCPGEGCRYRLLKPDLQAALEHSSYQQDALKMLAKLETQDCGDRIMDLVRCAASDHATVQTLKQCQVCPACLVVVRRENGCRHLVCRCSTELCFICGAPYMKCICNHDDSEVCYRQCSHFGSWLRLYSKPSPLTSCLDQASKLVQPMVNRDYLHAEMLSVSDWYGRQPTPHEVKAQVARRAQERRRRQREQQRARAQQLTFREIANLRQQWREWRAASTSLGVYLAQAGVSDLSLPQPPELRLEDHPALHQWGRLRWY